LSGHKVCSPRYHHGEVRTQDRTSDWSATNKLQAEKNGSATAGFRSPCSLHRFVVYSRITGGRLEVSCRRMKGVKHASFSGFLAATQLILPSCGVKQDPQRSLVGRVTDDAASELSEVRTREGAASVGVLKLSATARVSKSQHQAASGKGCPAPLTVACRRREPRYVNGLGRTPHPRGRSVGLADGSCKRRWASIDGVSTPPAVAR
jgi:hypothetical protein